MNWTFEEIQQDWLAGGSLAFTPETIVAAFDRAERILGLEWIRNSRVQQGGLVRGAHPTFVIVSMGVRLASIEDLTDTDRLIDGLKANDSSAASELSAIYLLRYRHPLETQLYPVVTVGGRNRIPDLRIRSQEESWVYTEVTRASESDAQKQSLTILSRLTNLVRRVEKSFALEVYLVREPSDAEMDCLEDKIFQFCQEDGEREEDLPGLGRLMLTDSIPGQVIVPSVQGNGENTIRLAMVQVISGGGQPPRHIVARMPFSDERAEQFLRDEAKQLPTDAPGLIMIDAGATPISLRDWEVVLKNRLQPAQHTRVSAIALFHSLGGLNDQAGRLGLSGRLLLNPHAKFRLPTSIFEILSEALSVDL